MIVTIFLFSKLEILHIGHSLIISHIPSGTNSHKTEAQKDKLLEWQDTLDYIVQTTSLLLQLFLNSRQAQDR